MKTHRRIRKRRLHGTNKKGGHLLSFLFPKKKSAPAPPSEPSPIHAVTRKFRTDLHGLNATIRNRSQNEDAAESGKMREKFLSLQPAPSSSLFRVLEPKTPLPDTPNTVVATTTEIAESAESTVEPTSTETTDSMVEPTTTLETVAERDGTSSEMQSLEPPPIVRTSANNPQDKEQILKKSAQKREDMQYFDKPEPSKLSIISQLNASKTRLNLSNSQLNDESSFYTSLAALLLDAKPLFLAGGCHLLKEIMDLPENANIATGKKLFYAFDLQPFFERLINLFENLLEAKNESVDLAFKTLLQNVFELEYKIKKQTFGTMLFSKKNTQNDILNYGTLRDYAANHNLHAFTYFMRLFPPKHGGKLRQHRTRNKRFRCRTKKSAK